MDRWTQYLLEGHSEEELRNWASRLKLFRFFRAHGGHANDGDALDVAFAYNGPKQLELFLATLDVELVRYDSRPPQPEPGISYRGDVFSQFPSLIAGTRWIAQPGHCEIIGIKAFIWCEADKVQISLNDGYTVSEKNVFEAETIEKVLTQTALARIDPPRDTKNYICPKYYPDYFND